MNIIIINFKGEDVHSVDIDMNGSSIYMIYVDSLGNLKRSSFYSQDITFSMASSATIINPGKVHKLTGNLDGESVEIVDFESNGFNINISYIDNTNVLKVVKKYIPILEEDSIIIATNCILSAS